MKVVHVVWKDACAEEANSRESHAVQPRLIELHEVGFLLAEDESAITIGMEMDMEGTAEPGRWRLHIPKANIVTMKTVDVGLPKPKRVRKPKVAEEPKPAYRRRK